MDHLSQIRSGGVEKAATVPGWAPPGTKASSLQDLAALTPATGQAPSPGPLPTKAPTTTDTPAQQPIRYSFPYAVNQTLTPRGTMTPFATLRTLADVVDVIRICIETRKDQVCSLKWDLALKNAKGKPDAKLEQKLADCRAFLFGKPDKRRRWNTWLRMAIEEVLVVDALSIYRRRTRGGQLYALEIKDGTTFKPLLDATGDTPIPPSVAFRQIINGQAIAGGDCTTDDLMYRPRTVRAHTPYGLSPVEAVLLAVNAVLNREVFNLNYYAEGNVPEGLVETPENWSVAQIKEFQDYWDAMLAGNLSMRRRLKIVGHGMSKVHEFKEADFSTAFDEWLLKIICAAIAVPPQEIGFTGDVNKATGQMQENVVYRRGVKPLAGFIKDILDEVLEDDLDAPEIEAVYSGGEPEDKLATAQADQLYVSIGKVSVDELRVRDGQEPIGLGPYIQTGMGPVFVEELINGVDDDPTTTDVDGEDDAAAAAPANQTVQEDEPDDPPTEAGDAADTELKKWRRMALQCVKRGQPIRAFRADHLAPTLVTKIGGALTTVDTMAGVVAVFTQVEKARSVAKKLKKAETALRRKSAALFAEQGSDLAEFLRTKVRELA